MQMKNHKMRAWIFINLAAFCSCARLYPHQVNLEGPELVQQPNSATYFSNSVGLNLECLGRGTPPLSTRWLTPEGQPLAEIPGIREIRNSSLHLRPFRGEDFLASVHDKSYRCSVTNPIGTTLSSIFSVHAVIDEPFEVSITSAVDENDVMEGNVVVLHCDVKPAIYKDFMKTIQWKSIDQYGHETEIESDGNAYQISAGGSLLILAVKYQQLFICVAQNTLNKKIQSSAPFMLKSRAAVGVVAPTSVGKWQRMIFTEIGKNIDLLCLSVGNPSPNFRWEKWVQGKFVPVVSVDQRGRIWGPLLTFFDGVTTNSNGTYRCEVVNSLASFFLQVDLIVSDVPRVELLPKRRTVGTGQNVDLLCELHFQSPRDAANHAEITWFHNGERLLDGGNRIRISSQRLSILNTAYEDQGVYQCFVQKGKHQVGAMMNILFPPSEPELIHTFISQLLQPGPLVSLKCSAVGNPIPTISFFHDGNLLSPTPDPYEQIPWRESNHRFASSNYVQMNEIVSHVNISSIQVQDSGEYKCTASNLLSSVSHSARINIYGRLFVKDMGQMTLVAGTVALIPCLYGGYPLDKVVWKQNGSEIDTKKNKSRFRILANGTLQIENIKPSSDKGQYICTVSNRKGETASGSATINVLRAPVISSFSFDDNLQEGQRTSISCNVMSGDLPIDIIWLKDSLPIPQFLNVTPMRVKFLSNLIFEELKGVHSGEYTCSASNAAATVNFSAQLLVKVPPTWLHEPTNTRSLLKSDLIIPCHAIASPRPTIRWYMDKEMKTLIRPDHKFQILENGTLMLMNVDTKDASNYTCEATNEVSTIQKTISISVIIPAKATASSSTLVVAEGLPALLKCHIHGDSPVQVVWKKKSIVIENSPPRIVLQTVLDANSSVGVFSAELKIGSSERSDSGSYYCLAFNEYGRGEDAISLQVKARPRPPQDVIIEEIQSRFLRIKWSLSENLSSDPVTHFVVQYKNSSVISWEHETDCTNITVLAPSTSAILRFLTPVTNYQLRIFSLNEIGQSLPTQPISVSTLAEAPSGPPLNVTAIATGTRTIFVSWEPPSPLLQNGEILGYYVLVNPTTISALSNSTLVIDEKWGHQTEINELKPNSIFKVSVRAYNQVGMGPESAFISISTPEGAPDSPPLNVTCEALSSKSLQTMWMPPPQHLANGIITGYKVIYSPVAEMQGEKPEVKKTINRETTLHGLSPYTSYSVKILAFTNGGESLPSEAVICTTEEDLPEEPSDIKVLPSGPNSVTVSWLPPRFPNGVILRYRIAWKSDDLDGVKERYYVPTGNEDQMLMEVRRLRENKRYTFWVTPATSLGLGKPSEMHDVTVTSKVAAKIVSFPVIRRQKLEQSVTLPCRAVGVGVEITWLKGSAPFSLNNIMRNGTLFIPRVKDQHEGVYSCRAENNLGTDEIHHQISISRPPSSVTILPGYVTSSSIQIHWEPPSKADPQLLGYILQYRSGSTMEWNSKHLGTRLTSFALDNLFCGTSYQIRLAPQNSIGLGEFSPILRTKTNGNPPAYPKLTEIIDGNGTMVRIDLSRWPDGGCYIKKFHLEFKNKASNEWKTVHRNNSSRIFILNTTLGTKYDFRISLENEAGLVSKTFSVESSPQFFTNYDKLMQNSGDAVLSGSSLYTDPHIIVPVISAITCTIAVIICILIVVKRKTDSGDGWKLGNTSTSQQTWLSSDDFRIEKPSEKSKIEVVPQANCGGMSIYATLNSRKPIPMTIRDSTVRFQTFGQVENYDAPPIQQTFGRCRGLNSSLSHEELAMQEVFAMNQKCRDTRDLQDFRRVANSNEYSVDEICHDYAHPYQVVPVNSRGPLDSDLYGRNTLRKQKRSRRGFGDQAD